MWGQCRGQAVTSPMETKFTKVDSTFACFASPPSMFRPLVVGKLRVSCIHWFNYYKSKLHAALLLPHPTLTLSSYQTLL